VGIIGSWLVSLNRGSGNSLRSEIPPYASRDAFLVIPPLVLEWFSLLFSNKLLSY
jgi:hypothetical protein